jgi:hypothetical protein
LEDVDVDGRIILKWIFKTWSVDAWTGFIKLGIGTGNGLLGGSRRRWEDNIKMDLQEVE